MVPEEIHCVLVAGDKVTQSFGVGPHELDLMLFNRQPSGLLFLVPKASKGQMGVTLKGDLERHLEIQVTDPIVFVQHFLIDENKEEDHEIWKTLFQIVDAAFLQTERPHIRETLQEILGQRLESWGLQITDFFEQPSLNAPSDKKTLRIRKTPFASSGPSEKPTLQPSAAANPTHTLTMKEVWATSTMDLFGKGELTLEVRVTAAKSPEALKKEDLVYDHKQRFESPDGWLDAKKWQEIPEGELVFRGLDPSWTIRLHVLAQERDKRSTDALGEVEFVVPSDQEAFEVGPTKGGKKDNHVILKATLEPSSR